MDKKRRAADRDHTQLEEEELEPEVLKRLKEKGLRFVFYFLCLAALGTGSPEI